MGNYFPAHIVIHNSIHVVKLLWIAIFLYLGMNLGCNSWINASWILDSRYIHDLYQASV